MEDVPRALERIVPLAGLGNCEEHARYYRACLPRVRDKFVLDIACGVGWGTHFLATRAAFACGVDVAPEAIAYARQEYGAVNVGFGVGDILAIPFPDGRFDVVTSIETFEHVPRSSASRLIAECRRVLRPGGVFLFSTPDGDLMSYRPATPAELRGYHFWHYTRDELHVLLQPAFRSVTIGDAEGSTYFVTCEV